jgi:hypothetical protein
MWADRHCAPDLVAYERHTRTIEFPGPAARASPQARRTWTGYEAIVTAAFARHPLWIICGYDVRRTPDETLDAAAG